MGGKTVDHFHVYDQPKRLDGRRIDLTELIDIFACVFLFNTGLIAFQPATPPCRLGTRMLIPTVEILCLGVPIANTPGALMMKAFPVQHFVRVRVVNQ